MRRVTDGGLWDGPTDPTDPLPPHVTDGMSNDEKEVNQHTHALPGSTGAAAAATNNGTFLRPSSSDVVQSLLLPQPDRSSILGGAYSSGPSVAPDADATLRRSTWDNVSQPTALHPARDGETGGGLAAAASSAVGSGLHYGYGYGYDDASYSSCGGRALENENLPTDARRQAAAWRSFGGMGMSTTTQPSRETWCPPPPPPPPPLPPLPYDRMPPSGGHQDGGAGAGDAFGPPLPQHDESGASAGGGDGPAFTTAAYSSSSSSSYCPEWSRWNRARTQQQRQRQQQQRQQQQRQQQQQQQRQQQQQQRRGRPGLVPPTATAAANHATGGHPGDHGVRASIYPGMVPGPPGGGRGPNGAPVARGTVFRYSSISGDGTQRVPQAFPHALAGPPGGPRIRGGAPVSPLTVSAVGGRLGGGRGWPGPDAAAAAVGARFLAGGNGYQPRVLTMAEDYTTNSTAGGGAVYEDEQRRAAGVLGGGVGFSSGSGQRGRSTTGDLAEGGFRVGNAQLGGTMAEGIADATVAAAAVTAAPATTITRAAPDDPAPFEDILSSSSSGGGGGGIKRPRPHTAHKSTRGRPKGKLGSQAKTCHGCRNSKGKVGSQTLCRGPEGVARKEGACNYWVCRSCLEKWRAAGGAIVRAAKGDFVCCMHNGGWCMFRRCRPKQQPQRKKSLGEGSGGGGVRSGEDT